MTDPRVKYDTVARSYTENRLEKDVQSFKNIMNLPIWTNREEVYSQIYPQPETNMRFVVGGSFLLV